MHVCDVILAASQGFYGAILSSFPRKSSNSISEAHWSLHTQYFSIYKVVCWKDLTAYKALALLPQ